MPRRKVTGPQMLVEAAARLFEQKGYQNTTIDDIARALGIAKPTVYQYVRSKGWLLERIFESVLVRLKSALDKVVQMEDPQAQVRAAVQYFVDAVHDLTPYFLIFFGEERELPPQTRKRFRAWGRELTMDVANMIERAQRAEVVRPDVDPKIAAFFLIGMLQSTARWYSPKGPLSKDEIAEQAYRMLQGFVLTDRRHSRPGRTARVLKRTAAEPGGAAGDAQPAAKPRIAAASRGSEGNAISRASSVEVAQQNPSRRSRRGRDG